MDSSVEVFVVNYFEVINNNILFLLLFSSPPLLCFENRIEYNLLSFFLFCVCFQARIAFLQGERKGQENLKKDLVRRIKMLEYALKQERYVYKLFSFYLTWKTLQTKRNSIVLCKLSLLGDSLLLCVSCLYGWSSLHCIFL